MVAGGCGGSSGPSGPVSFSTLAFLPPGGGPITGRYRSTGAIESTGTVYDTFRVLSSTKDSSRASVDRTYFSARGTLKVRFLMSQTNGRASGRWHVVSGTGDFEGLEGSGGYSGTIEFLPRNAEKISDVMTGELAKR